MSQDLGEVCALPAAVRWLLVAGAPRSGTTFLGRLIASHPRIALFTEGDLETIATRLRDLLAERIGLEVPAALDGASFAYLARAFYEARFGKRDLLFIGDKQPVAPDHASFFERVLRQPLMQIYIVRAPSAVIASSMVRSADPADTWHISTIEEAIVEWVRHYEGAAARIGTVGTLVICYEHFASHPWRAIGAVAKFLGVDPDLFRNDFTHKPPAPTPSAAGRMLVEAVLGNLERSFLADFESCLREWPIVHLPLPLGSTLPVTDANTLMALCLKRGWGGLEMHGAWTVSESAELVFRVEEAPGKVVDVTLFVVGFLGDRAMFEFAIVNGTGERSGFVLTPSPAPREISVPSCVLAGGVVSLTFEISRPKTAQEAPLHDPRQLGVLLQAIRVSGPSRTSRDEPDVSCESAIAP